MVLTTTRFFVWKGGYVFRGTAMTIRLLFEFLLLDIYSVECFDMDILHCAAYGHSSSSLLRVAEVGLLNDVGDDDDKAEVLPRDLVVQVVGFRAELEALLVEGRGYGLAWRWVLERTWEGN
jgi:hypothetical protein